MHDIPHPLESGEGLLPVRQILGFECLAKLGNAVGPVLEPHDRVGVPLVVDQVRPAQPGAEVRPEPVGLQQHKGDEPTVLGSVHAGHRVGHLREVELRDVLSGDARADDVGTQLPDRGVEQRHVDDGRLAGALPLEEGTGNARGNRQATVDVTERGPLNRRVRPVAQRVGVSDSAARPVRRQVETALGGQLTLGAVAVPAGVDDLGVAARM